MGAGNWGDDPETLGGRIMATHEIGQRIGYGAADRALEEFDKGRARELASHGLGSLAAEDAARKVVQEGVFGLGSFDDIFGKR
jgi:hypothetical protein